MSSASSDVSVSGRRRALITGAEGFVGGYLRRRLESTGWEVVGTARDAKSAGDAPLVVCDVREPAHVEQVFRVHGPFSHVFHLAALAHVPAAIDDPASTLRINTEGTIHVAEAMARVAPDGRMVYVASSEMYGRPSSLPVTEDHPLSPGNPYAISKAAADWYCRYAAAKGAAIIRMRPFNHTGPGQPDSFVLPSFARQIARIEAGTSAPVLHVGNLGSARDFLHVEDVVRAYECAALGGSSGEAYNVCSGTSRTIGDILDQLLSLTQAPITVTVEESRVRSHEASEMRGSHDKLTEHTGWTPEIAFDDLLSGLLDYWRMREGAPTPVR